MSASTARNPVSATPAAAGVGGVGGVVATRAFNDVVLPLLERQYQATAQASAMTLFSDALCGEVSRRYLNRTCGLLGNKDHFEQRTPWATAKAAFERDLEDLPVTLAMELPAHTTTLGRVIFPAAIEFARSAALGLDAGALVVGLQEVGCGLHGPNGDPRSGEAKVALAVYSLAIAFETLSTLDDTHDVDLLVEEALRLFEAEIAGSCVAVLWTDDMSRRIDELEAAFERIYRLREELKEVVANAGASRREADRFGAYVDVLSAIIAQGSALVIWPEEMTDSLEELEEDVREGMAAIQQGLDLIRALTDAEYARAFVELLVLAETSGVPLPDPIIQWAPFMADIAQAESSEALTGAIEAILAPIGSFRGKREKKARTFAVSFFPGARIGREWSIGGTDRGARWDVGGGGSAPLGLEYSRSTRFGYLGGFISIVDVGAHLNYKLGSAEADDLSNRDDVQIDQIFAPGAWLTFGIGRKLPITAGLGGSLLKDRREASMSTAEPVSQSVFQFSLFVGFDIPLFTF